MGAGAYWFVVHCSGHRGADRARSPRWRYRVAPAPVVRQKHGAALVPEPALNPRGVAVRGFWMLLALVVAFPAVAGRDAPADYSRAPDQPVDQASTDLNAKDTTDPKTEGRRVGKEFDSTCRA